MRTWPVIVCLLAACEEGPPPGAGTGADLGFTEWLPLQLDAACELDPVAPRKLVVTTTDFATGAVSTVDLASGTVAKDLALGSSDALPFHHAGKVYLLHRYGLDYVDVLDADSFELLAEHPLEVSGVTSPNGHSIAFAPDGTAAVVFFASPTVQLHDFSRPPGQSLLHTLSLTGFADEDGNPDAGLSLACGNLLLVALSRLDESYRPRDRDWLVGFDFATRLPVDLRPSEPGLQALVTGGGWLKQLRRDPKDPSGHTLLALTTGVERIDLARGEIEWAVSEQAFATAGITDRLLPQSFAVDATGEFGFLAAYEADFSGVGLYRLRLHDDSPPERFASGFDSVEHTVELAGDQLWYGSTKVGAPGLWKFSAQSGEVLLGPVSTGLPPYAMIAIP